MAERVKKLLDKVRKTGQEVYGTKDTPFRTGIKVALDAGTGFKDLKTNLGIKALRKLLAQVNPNSPQAKEIREEISRRDPDKPPSADTRRMQEESTQNKINRANEEGVQESKTLPKTPKTPPKAGKKKKTAKPGMGKKTNRTGQGSMRGPGRGYFMGSGSGGSGLTPRVTMTEVGTDQVGGSGKGGGTKKAKGGMINKKPSAKKTSKKKTSVQKKPRGVGAATRGYGRALR